MLRDLKVKVPWLFHTNCLPTVGNTIHADALFYATNKPGHLSTLMWMDMAHFNYLLLKSAITLSDDEMLWEKTGLRQCFMTHKRTRVHPLLLCKNFDISINFLFAADVYLYIYRC